MNEINYLIAKILHLQETNVSLAEKNVPNWEKVSLAETVRLIFPR